MATVNRIYAAYENGKLKRRPSQDDEVIFTAVRIGGSGGKDLTLVSGNFDFATGKLVNIGTPTSASDAATKGYVDTQIENVSAGYDPKASTDLATVAALPAVTYNNGTAGVGATLTADANGALSVDGVAVNVGERVLVKNQVSGAHNGIYVVTAAGDGGNPFVLTRATDFDNSPSNEVTKGARTLITGGNTLIGKSFFLTTSGAVTIGTTSLAFSEASGAAPVTSVAGKTGTVTLVAADVTDFDAAALAAAVQSGAITNSVTKAPTHDAVFDALALKADASLIGANSGIASLDSGGKVPLTQLPDVVTGFKGNWSPASNSPFLSDTGLHGEANDHNNVMRYTAVAAGPGSTAISITYVNDGTFGAETATVLGNAITVHIEEGQTTDAEVATAFDNEPAATALVNYFPQTSDFVTAGGPTFLSAGYIADGGESYRVSFAGTNNLGSGSKTYSVGDLIVHSGSVWVQDAIFTDARARAAAVANTITDNVNDIAPSQNAVFDALALKANLSTTYSLEETLNNSSGDTLTIRQFVYKATGTIGVDLVDVTDALADYTVFRMVKSATIADTINGVFYTPGQVVGGFTGLTAHAPVYASRTTPGGLTQSLSGFVAGEQVILIGYALSTTDIQFDPKHVIEF